MDAPGYVSVIHGDGRDFYSYLPDIFIHKNLGHQDPGQPWILQTATGSINIHTAGVAVLLLPFFAIGALWASLGGYPVDGMSEPFHKMVSMGALFYMMLGLFFIKKLLAKMNIRDGIIAIVLLLIFFGTNLINYGLNEPSMSHAYSFFAIAAFLYTSHQLFQTEKTKYLYLAALFYGLVILIRPVNAIVILILPFWANTLQDFVTKIKSFLTPKRLIASVLICGSVLFIQSAIWLAQNGHLVQWAQKHDGFYFSNPHPLLMLFGFDMGFFIYTPACFIMLFGLLPLYIENKFRFAALALFIAFWFYLFSSHWGYTYFDGLSIRPMVDYYALFAVLAALLIQYLSGIKRVMMGTVLGCAAFINLVYCYQYKVGIIPPAAMSFEKWKYVFMKVSPQYAGILGGSMDLVPFSENHPKASFTSENGFDDKPEKFFTYDQNEYGVEYRSQELGFKSNKLFFRINFKCREASLNSSSGALLAISVEDAQHQVKHFQACKLKDVPSETCCEWKECIYQVNMPQPQYVMPDDRLVIFVWNKEKQKFFIDDFKVEVYNYNVEI